MISIRPRNPLTLGLSLPPKGEGPVIRISYPPHLEPNRGRHNVNLAAEKTCAERARLHADSV